MAAWNMPLMSTLVTCAVKRAAILRRALELPGADPVEELRARRLHRLLGGDHLDRIDRDEVVGVLVGRDALVEVAHLDVILAPGSPAGQGLDLDALQGLDHLRLGRPLTRTRVR